MGKTIVTTPIEPRKRISRLTEHYRKMRETFRDGTLPDGLLMELDTLAHFFEAGGTEHYGQIAAFCKLRGIERVVDIGCAYGHQSEFFLEDGIGYFGVDREVVNFWNADIFDYQVGHYPCELRTYPGDLAISVLCLTWGCYLKNGEITHREQCEALARDFEHCLIYGKATILREVFLHVEEVDEKLYYCRRKA